MLRLAPILATALLAGGGPSGASERFGEWAAETAIHGETLNDLLSPTNRPAILAALADARILGLGESRHDTREQTLLKDRLLRLLIEEGGVRALVIEESHPHARALDRHVTTGEGDPGEILAGLAGWYLWDTREMRDCIEWIRQFNAANASHPESGPVRIFGMDITAPAPGVREVLTALQARGMEPPSPEALGLDLHAGDLWPQTWQRYGELDDRRRQQIADAYHRLLELVDQAALGPGPAILAEIGRRGHELFSSPGREAGGAVREAGMARVLGWLLEHEIPEGDRVVVWMHNLHAATAPFRMPGLAEGELRPVGIQLRRAYGDDYLAVGAAFGSGAYPPDLPPGERDFAVLPAHTLDGALARVGYPFFLLDLRRAGESPAAAGWLDQPRVSRSQDAEATLVPSQAFDLVFYVDRISRALPGPRRDR